MKSSSQIKEQNKEQNSELVVNIDFDEASTAWKANKKSKGNGTYRYI
jgi:hypothetical protein